MWHGYLPAGHRSVLNQQGYNEVWQAKPTILSCLAKLLPQYSDMYSLPDGFCYAGLPGYACLSWHEPVRRLDSGAAHLAIPVVREDKIRTTHPIGGFHRVYIPR